MLQFLLRKKFKYQFPLRGGNRNYTPLELNGEGSHGQLCIMYIVYAILTKYFNVMHKKHIVRLSGGRGQKVLSYDIVVLRCSPAPIYNSWLESIVIWYSSAPLLPCSLAPFYNSWLESIDIWYSPAPLLPCSLAPIYNSWLESWKYRHMI